jgi:hypothetical protein
MADFHGKEVVAPWRERKPAKYPPPSAKLLELHYHTAISVSLKAAAEVAEDDSGDSDDEADVSDHVRSWVEDHRVENT